MIGLVGLAVLFGQHLTVSLGALVYWLVVLLIVVWILVIAAADWAVTRMYLSQLQNRQLEEQARLAAEFRRANEPAGSEAIGDDFVDPADADR